MGLLNALFAPFIFVYLLVFFFFRYFEASRIFDLLSYPLYLSLWMEEKIGVPQESKRDWIACILSVCKMEVPRIQ